MTTQPHGVAVIVKCMTDNLNRTVAAMRAIFTKYGGSLSKSGSFSFLFDCFIQVLWPWIRTRAKSRLG